VQFLEELRREGRGAWAAVPIVLLTGAMDAKQIARARELGARDVLVKARFQVDDLLRRVGQHVRGEPLQGAA
jgi:DNA-binding response OmpR family regulator